MDDDLTPNDSEALGVWEPEEDETQQKIDEQKQVKVNLAKIVADDIMAWFESSLEEIETIDAVKKTVNTYKDELKGSVDNAFVAHHLTATLLSKLKNDFKATFVIEDEKDEDDE